MTVEYFNKKGWRAWRAWYWPLLLGMLYASPVICTFADVELVSWREDLIIWVMSFAGVLLFDFIVRTATGAGPRKPHL